MKPGRPTASVVYDPASFRDRHGRVFYDGDRVLRGLSSRALENWRRVSSCRFFQELVDEGKVVRTREVASPAEGVDWEGALEHERIPVISYPYEWPFSMLKAAASLQLEVTRRALSEGIALRDASAYNIQWIGARPVFIDIPSFEPLRAGGLWTGYRQFCEMFLYPLVLQAYRGIDFQPMLRGNPDGVPVATVARILRVGDRLKKGVLTHVDLHALLQRRSQRVASMEVASDIREAGAHGTEIMDHNLRGLQGLIAGLRWNRSGSHWTAYESTNTYSRDDAALKENFVREHVRSANVVLDLGCNTGRFSMTVAQEGCSVVAVDSDHAVVERLFQDASERKANVLPLVWDVASPSPGIGWCGAERPMLERRIDPDLILVLALIHHLVVGRNIPLEEVIEYLAGYQADLVIEFVERDDPMVRTLLAGKDQEFADYDRSRFESILERTFVVTAVLPLPSGLRRLYHCRPKRRES
ncbi:MAG: class I SAM-dependent methyltransferase [Thermoanaerobaculia bacterium]